MKKIILIICGIILISGLLFFLCGTHGYAAKIKNSMPEIYVIKITKHQNLFERLLDRVNYEIEYEVLNQNKEDIWVCFNVGSYKPKTNPYNLEINSNNGKVVLKVENVSISKDAQYYEPIYAGFVKVSPNSKNRFKILLSFPLKLTRTKIDLKDLSSLVLEIEYYDFSISKIKGCCQDRGVKNELYVNCFWANDIKNKAKKIIYKFPQKIIKELKKKVEKIIPESKNK